MKLRDYEIDMKNISEIEFLEFISFLKSKGETVNVEKYSKDSKYLWYSTMTHGWKQWPNNNHVSNLISIEKAVKLFENKPKIKIDWII